MSFRSRTGERPTGAAPVHRARTRARRPVSPVASTPEATPLLLSLQDERAATPEWVGAKAAGLARAGRAGLPVLPGVVITTAATRLPSEALDAVLDLVWETFVETPGRTSVVVRSSSTVEDSAVSSMAGMFTSVLDVRSRHDFGAAVAEVIESARLGSTDDNFEAAPMAVLIQPYLRTGAGGVLFGVDPVDGNQHRMAVAASPEGPAAVVGGATETTPYSMSRRGRLPRSAVSEGGLLTRRQLRSLARLARRAERVFGGPQDIEWALGPERPSERGTGPERPSERGTGPERPSERGTERLWLLQSRPITAVGDAVSATGPVLGPGPVAETFPDPLSILESDLWVAPLRKALAQALILAGTVSRRRLAASPVVTTVEGRPAVDLDLLGPSARKSFFGRLDPRPPLRRLVAAWRVGRLRAALPALATDLIARADSELLALPTTEGMTDGQLLRLLGRSGQALTALHGHEVLMGWLVDPGTSALTAASVALRRLEDGRREGLSDAEIVFHRPEVLALVAPSIHGSSALLPATGAHLADVEGTVARPEGSPRQDADDSAMLREALRLRVRWVQELTGVVAWALGRRLAQRGVLAGPAQVRLLTLEELRTAVRTGSGPADLDGRQPPANVPPLPSRFRMTPGGGVVAVHDPRSGTGGVGAGGGRALGVVQPDGNPAPGGVLVVRTLDPGLAPLLLSLRGLVAETGSPLSHLAILARELGVATAVGVDDAVNRFPPGSTVVVDGSSGEVTLVTPGGAGV